ncbi:hypothetical protein FACS1894147_02760 [Spirochaetia bacterium]|nr:hypothetical protein FACS1894147_02760 [Spirochaetia bacterium]
MDLGLPDRKALRRGGPGNNSGDGKNPLPADTGEDNVFFHSYPEVTGFWGFWQGKTGPNQEFQIQTQMSQFQN